MSACALGTIKVKVLHVRPVKPRRTMALRHAIQRKRSRRLAMEMSVWSWMKQQERKKPQ